MHKFLSKFIVIAVIVNLFTGIIAISLSDTALAQTPQTTTNPDGTQQIEEGDFLHFCMQWAASFNYGDAGPGFSTGLTSETVYLFEGEMLTSSEITNRKAQRYQEQIQFCMENPDKFINSNLEKFDLNVILKRGKQFLPEVTPELINFPEIPGTEGLDPAEGIPELIAFVYLIGLWLVGVAVFVQITIGGVRWLLSAGKPGEIEKAKSQITNAIFGLILLLSSYVILNTINPDLVNGIFETKPIGGGPTIPH